MEAHVSSQTRQRSMSHDNDCHHLLRSSLCTGATLSISDALFYLILSKDLHGRPYYYSGHFTEPHIRVKEHIRAHLVWFQRQTTYPVTKLASYQLDSDVFLLLLPSQHPPPTSPCSAAASSQMRQRTHFMSSSIKKVPIFLPMSEGNEHMPSWHPDLSQREPTVTWVCD